MKSNEAPMAAMCYLKDLAERWLESCHKISNANSNGRSSPEVLHEVKVN